jgi:hypothetical protein
MTSRERRERKALEWLSNQDAIEVRGESYVPVSHQEFHFLQENLDPQVFSLADMSCSLASAGYRVFSIDGRLVVVDRCAGMGSRRVNVWKFQKRVTGELKMYDKPEGSV